MTDNKVICPECGRVPVGPTEAYTLRRRKMLIAVASVLFVSAIVVQKTPTIQAGGWLAVLPMSTQIRLWRSGDKPLRKRILNAYISRDLSKIHLNLLRNVIHAALDDPMATQAELLDASHFVVISQNREPIIDDAHIEQAIRDSNSQIQESVLRYCSWQRAPPADAGVRSARRQAALSENKIAIEWLLEYPSDDDEDMETIGRLITDSEDNAFWTVRNLFDSASSHAIDIVSDLLGSDSVRVRRRAMNCMHEYARHRNTNFSTRTIDRIYTLIHDPDPDIQRSALRTVEYLPESADPMLKRVLQDDLNDKSLSLLIHEIVRRSPDSVSLTPTLAALSRDDRNSFQIRLECVDAYRNIRSRAQSEDEPEALWPIYDTLLTNLSKGDFETALRYGKENRYAFDHWAAGSIARLLINEQVSPDQLSSWFDLHPGVVALLKTWNLEGDRPEDMYIHALDKILDEHSRAPEIVRNQAAAAFDAHFPVRSKNPSPDQSTIP